MKNTIIAVLAVALVIVVLYVFIAKGPGPAGPRPAPQTSTNDNRLVSRTAQVVPAVSVRELSATRSSNEPASSHNPESAQAPVAEPSSPATDESNAALPKDHIAWSQERQMRQLLDMDPGQLAKFRTDYRHWIGGKLAGRAKINLTSDEIEQLTEVFMDATMAFCRQWHPILKDGLTQPGKARDRLALLNGVNPDMMLMLYAIPTRREAITGLVGAERYEKMNGVVDGAFQEWYQDLTSGVEYAEWMLSLDAETQQKVFTTHGRWVHSQNGRPRLTKWIESDDFRQLKEDIQK